MLGTFRTETKGLYNVHCFFVPSLGELRTWSLRTQTNINFCAFRNTCCNLFRTFALASLAASASAAIALWSCTGSRTSLLKKYKREKKDQIEWNSPLDTFIRARLLSRISHFHPLDLDAPRLRSLVQSGLKMKRKEKHKYRGKEPTGSLPHTTYMKERRKTPSSAWVWTKLFASLKAASFSKRR